MFSNLLVKKTINVGPVSYIPRKDLAIIAHVCDIAVLDVAAFMLRNELKHGWYDTYKLLDILMQYGYLSRAHSTMIVFCSNSFTWWRRRAAECPPVFDLDPFWVAGQSRIVSKTVSTVVTPSVFTAA